MNYKMQLSPMSSAPTSPSKSADWFGSPANCEETKVFRSWLVYDPETPNAGARVHFNWNLLLGVAVAASISAAFWVGIGLMVARLWH